MLELMPEKTKDFIEAECLKVARYGLGCSELEAVSIVRIKPEGSGPNWEVGSFSPALPEVALKDAKRRIDPLRQEYALA
jgi:hypothetical protein